MVETETGLKVKCLRLDNGREYIDGGFSEFCVVHRIRMEKTILGTPQQNGVAERMNRTLNECARSMSCMLDYQKLLNGKNLPLYHFKPLQEV